MVAGNRWADPEFLRSDQYRSEANLRARQSIYAFQQPRVDLPSVVLDLVSPTGDDRVIDVGCGNGAYLSELVRRGICQSVTGVDLSEGMLRAAQKAAPGTQTLVAEASALPLRDATATLVLAMHMLYHVPQPAVAVEISCDVDEEVMNRRQRVPFVADTAEYPRHAGLPSRSPQMWRSRTSCFGRSGTMGRRPNARTT